MKLLIIFSTLPLLFGLYGFTNSEIFSNKNKIIIDKLIHHYSIRNVYIAAEKKIDFEIYLKHFLDLNLTFNIHTEDVEFPEYEI